MQRKNSIQRQGAEPKMEQLECKHCDSKGYCTLFECRCDKVGYCGVKS